VPDSPKELPEKKQNWRNTVAIGMVAHTQREERAEKVCGDIDADVCNIDDGTLGCEDNHLEVLNQLKEKRKRSEWVVVLEDDAVVIDDFRNEVGRALASAPAPIVGLYLGTGNPSGETQRQIREAVTRSQGWILGDALIGGVGYAIRRDLLKDIIDGITDRKEELPLRISRWAQQHKILIAYPQPSLVDHQDIDPVGKPHRGPHYLPRKAWNFGPPRANWQQPAVQLGTCPGWSTVHPLEGDWMPLKRKKVVG
jgi:hypothetical protein